MLRTSFALLLAALTALAFAASASAARNQISIFEASNLVLTDEHRNAALDEIDALGADALRVVLYWRDVAPDANARTRPSFDATDPSAYPGFAPYDRAIAEARARGLRVLLTVTGPVPRWATRTKRDQVSDPSPAEYRRFVTAVGRRYGSEVTWWTLWNEPNQSSFLKPQRKRGRPYAPRLWRQLFLAGRAGLRAAGQSRARILLGDTGPRGATSPIAFLREALCLNSRWRKRRGCGRLTGAGWAHHPYSSRSGPWVVPRNRNEVTLGSLSRLSRALDRAGRARATNRGLPIYITEFGVQSYPDRLFGVPWARQAAHLAAAERMAWRNRRVRSFSQYLLRDDEPRWGLPRVKRYSGFESGLRTWEGKAKPAYDAYRLPLVAQRTSRRWVRLWAHVRPATGKTRVSLQFRDRGSRSWRRLKVRTTDRHGFTQVLTRYRSGRRWRVGWTAPDGATYHGPATGLTRR
jgi:hypothetical protein